MPRGILIITAGPGCLLAAGLALTLVMAAFDRHPIWPYVTLNLSEAAAARDLAEAARLIEQGENLNLPREIRPGVLFDRPVVLTPMEAAVASRDVSVITTLLALGATMTADERARLRCVAEGDDVPRLLDALRPEGLELSCEEVTSPW